MDQNNNPIQNPAPPQGRQVNNAAAPNSNQAQLYPDASTMANNSIQAVNTSQSPQYNTSVNNAGNVIFSCPASYVKGVSAFSYHGGTLYVFNDRMVLSNNKGAVFFQAVFSEISNVTYKKTWRTKIISVQTASGRYQIAPFEVSSRSLVIGYICGIVAFFIAAYGGALGALFLLAVIIVSYVFSFKNFRKNHQNALQLLNVLKQYVHVT